MPESIPIYGMEFLPHQILLNSDEEDVAEQLTMYDLEFYKNIQIRYNKPKLFFPRFLRVFFVVECQVFILL